MKIRSDPPPLALLGIGDFVNKLAKLTGAMLSLNSSHSQVLVDLLVHKAKRVLRFLLV